jgi:oligoribonuclease NrnB/cAMP/cGMP phosphodiesterase (DHH superfamily)
MKTFVLYHHPCTDGTAAALAASLGGACIGAEYIGVKYGDRPAIPPGSLVYMLDFSYPRAALEALANEGTRVVILDHHKTAAEDLAGLPDPGGYSGRAMISARFDMKKSGAALAWEFFHGTDGGLPPMFAYIQDRDLWRWELKGTKDFAAYLSSIPTTIKDYRKVYEGWELNAPKYLEAGASILRLQDEYVSRMVKNAFKVVMFGQPATVVNAPILQSEVCDALLKLNDGATFAGAWSTNGALDKWSLRSWDGGADVSKLAAIHEGGGHRNAAGFAVPAGLKLFSNVETPEG